MPAFKSNTLVTTALTSLSLAVITLPNSGMANCLDVTPLPNGYARTVACTGASGQFQGSDVFVSIENGAVVQGAGGGRPGGAASIKFSINDSELLVKNGGSILDAVGASVGLSGFNGGAINAQPNRTTAFPDFKITVEQGGVIRASDPLSYSAISTFLNGDGVFTLSNSGLIEGTHHAIRVSSSTSESQITNEATGVIRSHGSVVGTPIETGVGVVLDTAATLINKGLIENTQTGLAVKGLRPGQTVITSGTIKTAGVTAIDLGEDDDALELQPGFVIIGNVIGGDGTDTLRFGGDGAASFGLGAIGSGQQYREFEVVKVTNGEWSFTGVTTNDVTVENGIVKGTGTFGNLTFTGGTFAPGNSIGTINVAGNLVLGAGATYEAEVNATGQSDLVAVTGTTTIDTRATLSIKGEAGTYPKTSQIYIVLTSTGGVTGSFGTVTDDLPDVDFTANYTANEVRLSYAKIPTTTGSIATPAPLTSPKEVLSASISSAGAAGSLFGASVNRARPGGTSKKQRLSFENLPSDFTLSTQNAIGRNWTVWTAAIGQQVTVGSSGGFLGWNARIGGGLIGIDAAPDIGMPMIATAALGYTNTQTTVGTATSNVGTTHLGLAASMQTGAWTIDAGLSYGKQSYTNTRRIPVGAAMRTATGKTTGSSIGVNLNSFLDLAALRGLQRAGLSFGPTLGLDYSQTKQLAYSENGAGILNLNVASASTTTAVARLGLAGSMTHKIGRASVIFNGLVAMERNLKDRSSTTIATLPVTGQQFTSTSAPIDLHRAVIGLGASMELGGNISAYVSYEGRMDNRSSDHGAAIGVSVKF